MHKIKWYILLSLTLSLVVQCISPPESSVEKKREVKDMLGRNIQIPEKIDRVVAIGPGALRLITYLKATDKVVGVEEIERRSGRPYIFACPGLKEKPFIGPPFTGDLELIAARNPDLIVKTYTSKSQAAELQEKTDIPVVGIEYTDKGDNWNSLEKSLQLLGDILDKEGRADSLISYFRSSIDSLGKMTSKVTVNKKVYAGGISHRGIHGMNSTSLYYEPFEFVNASNVASSLREKYDNMEEVIVDREQLILWDPDVIFLDLAGIELIKQDYQKYQTFYKNISGFKSNNLYGIHPYNWYSVNYATVLANAWYIGSVLYPGKFEEIDISRKADEIYYHFLGDSIYSRMKKEYGAYERISLEAMVE